VWLICSVKQARHTSEGPANKPTGFSRHYLQQLVSPWPHRKFDAALACLLLPFQRTFSTNHKPKTTGQEDTMKRLLTTTVISVALALAPAALATQNANKAKAKPAKTMKTMSPRAEALKKCNDDYAAAVKKANADYAAAVKDAKGKKGKDRAEAMKAANKAKKDALAAAAKAKKDCIAAAPKK
jgi:hypothetical protein